MKRFHFGILMAVLATALAGPNAAAELMFT